MGKTLRHKRLGAVCLLPGRWGGRGLLAGLPGWVEFRRLGRWAFGPGGRGFGRYTGSFRGDVAFEILARTGDRAAKIKKEGGPWVGGLPFLLAGLGGGALAVGKLLQRG